MSISSFEPQTKLLYDAVTWALGANGPFPPQGTMDGKYWWRGELAERAGLTWNGMRYVPFTPPQAATRSQKMAAAGFTKRDTRIACDECGALCTPQFLPVHKCGSEATQAGTQSTPPQAAQVPAEIDHIMELVQDFGDAMLLRGKLAVDMKTSHEEYGKAFDASHVCKDAVRAALAAAPSQLGGKG